MRLLHTMLRVGDLQRSIDFYTNVLGMKLLRTSENPEYKYSLAFVDWALFDSRSSSGERVRFPSAAPARGAEGRARDRHAGLF